jgi:serine/threonine protein kinase
MIGQIVGNYKIEEKLGEGGMGAVYRGVDTMLDREVAIKALRPELASQTSVVERFRSEAVTLSQTQSSEHRRALHCFGRAKNFIWFWNSCAAKRSTRLCSGAARCPPKKRFRFSVRFSTASITRTNSASFTATSNRRI